MKWTLIKQKAAGEELFAIRSANYSTTICANSYIIIPRLLNGLDKQLRKQNEQKSSPQAKPRAIRGVTTREAY